MDSSCYFSAPEHMEGPRWGRRGAGAVHRPEIASMPTPEVLERTLTQVSSYWEQQESESESEVYSHSACERSPERGYESAGNKSTPNKTPTKGGRRVKRDSLASRTRKGKPGSRRHQRWLNEAKLGRRANESFDLGPDRDDYIDEFFDDYAETPLSLMVEFPELRRAWQPFVNVTEEQELAMLRQLKGRSALYSSDEEMAPGKRSKKSYNFVVDSGRQFHAIPKETRQLLRKYHESPLLDDLDTVLSKFMRCSLAPSAALEQSYEFFSSSFERVMPDYAQAFPNAVPGYLILGMKDSLHRRLVHGICTYYNMFSETHTCSSEKVMVIGRPKAHQYPTQPFLSYLQQTQTDVMYWKEPPRSRPRKRRSRPRDSSCRTRAAATAPIVAEFSDWVVV